MNNKKALILTILLGIIVILVLCVLYLNKCRIIGFISAWCIGGYVGTKLVDFYKRLLK